ncbi:Myotubularin-related protein 3 [Geodia barretti]|uniref:Myotubularin-related protein 3 n=1 Tax=Geodia barretti TaxID=519541 RepID=A0AA35VWN0_GEOBA|nr:Myotubularin-related protein 3 [Geodia barretti]
MQMDVTGSWRISDCNCEYKLCPTYPKLLVVPSSLTEEEMRSAAKFRAIGRFPTIVWRHTRNGAVIARSSQPLVGVLGWRNPEDEKLLHAVSLSCSTPVTGHTPSNGSSSPVPIPFRNGGPPAQMMDDRGQLVQSVFMNNGHTSEPLAFETSHSQFVLQDVIQTCPELHDGRTACPELQDGHTACPELQDGHTACPELLVMDLRSYTAALGNRAKGGGCECTDYYPNCEVVYKNLPNIHSVRKSFQQLRSALLNDDQSNFLSNLEGTQWLHYLCQLISVACDVVQTVHDKARPVLVHCSDGWDRTAQVVPLAELMLDPYYRTIEGFQVLVEREWLGFGHRFSDRCGQHAACPDVNQRSPVFLQWLDCVHQLLLQFPSHFQFNHNFLVKMGLHSYSCLYGTLLGNSMKERDGARIGKRTLSLWSLLNPRNPEVVNHLFTTAGPRVLRPEANTRKMELWRAMFLAPCLTPSSALSSTHTPNTTTTSTSVSSTAPSTSTQVESETGSDVIAVPLPKEVEMKEIAGATVRGRGHSDSSFASVSSSSSPVPPLEGAERGADINTTPGDHEGTEETRSMEDKDAVTQPGHENVREDLSFPPPCDVSHDVTIETDSTHTNHIAPPPLLSRSHTAELPLVSRPLSANPHTHLFTSVTSDLLHDAIHDHSPRQQHGESFLNGAHHIVGRSSLPLAATRGAVDEEMWPGVRIDSDGITSRVREEDWRLLRVLQCYEARIAGPEPAAGGNEDGVEGVCEGGGEGEWAEGRGTQGGGGRDCYDRSICFGR